MAITERQRAHLSESLDVAVRCGYGSEEDVVESFEEQVRDELRHAEVDDLEVELAVWMGEMHRALADQRERERSWTERTHNDRIDIAFAKLRARGIVALQDAGYTMSDGWSDVHEALGGVEGAWGAVFFHRQDVERGVEGAGLMLAFGAFVEGDQHEPETLRLGAEIREVLEAEGVPTEWNGSLRSRIEILPFAWRKRR